MFTRACEWTVLRAKSPQQHASGHFSEPSPQQHASGHYSEPRVYKSPPASAPYFEQSVHASIQFKIRLNIILPIPLSLTKGFSPSGFCFMVYK
jgi:hypothetical protein